MASTISTLLISINLHGIFLATSSLLQELLILNLCCLFLAGFVFLWVHDIQKQTYSFADQNKQRKTKSYIINKCGRFFFFFPTSRVIIFVEVDDILRQHLIYFREKISP